jgi:hypothetical protein
MYDLMLNKLRLCVARHDRDAALELLRAETAAGLIKPRDVVELLLVVRDGTPGSVIEAIDAMRLGVPGSYRYIPAADHAAA